MTKQLTVQSPKVFVDFVSYVLKTKVNYLLSVLE